MRYNMTYSDGREWGCLTDERAESSRNIPVLIVDGHAYGPADLVQGLPNEDILGATVAAQLVATWAGCAVPADARRAADKFCRQWSDGPQVSGLIRQKRGENGA